MAVPATGNHSLRRRRKSPSKCSDLHCRFPKQLFNRLPVPHFSPGLARNNGSNLCDTIEPQKVGWICLQLEQARLDARPLAFGYSVREARSFEFRVGGNGYRSDDRHDPLNAHGVKRFHKVNYSFPEAEGDRVSLTDTGSRI